MLGPWSKTEFYGNAGYGLHSNDMRGVTITVDPPNRQTPDCRQHRVPLLVRSKGAELGLRNQGDRRADELAGGVRARLRTPELLFVGDAGTTEAEPAEPPRRRRVDQPLQAAAVARARSRPRHHAAPASPISILVGDYIPGAPADDRLASRLTFGEATGWFGSAEVALFRAAAADRGRQRAVADRSLIVNARVGYRFDNGIRVQLDALNLFNSKTNQIEYFYASRLPGEPVDGVDDVTSIRSSRHPFA